MDLGGQIRKYRDQLRLSQEELADRVFVTRQSVSNWENGRTYPDLQSLLRLSDLFGVSLDALIKGDLEEMKREIDKAEVQRFNFYGSLLAVLMLALIILPVPLILWLDTLGFFLVMGPLFAAAMVVASKTEKIKKANDLHTYMEIIAFDEGRQLDEIEKAREEGKRPYQAILMPLAAAAIAAAVGALLFWLLG